MRLSRPTDWQTDRKASIAMRVSLSNALGTYYVRRAASEPDKSTVCGALMACAAGSVPRS